MNSFFNTFLILLLFVFSALAKDTNSKSRLNSIFDSLSIIDNKFSIVYHENKSISTFKGLILIEIHYNKELIAAYYLSKSDSTTEANYKNYLNYLQVISCLTNVHPKYILNDFVDNGFVYFRAPCKGCPIYLKLNGDDDDYDDDDDCTIGVKYIYNLIKDREIFPR